MKTNRILLIQLFALLVVIIASLTACHWDTRPNPREGIDIIPVVNAFHIAIINTNAADYRAIVPYWSM